MHIIRVPQQMRLVAPALLQALELGAVEVVGQDRLVVGVCALFDDLACSFPGRHARDAGEALLCHDDVEVVLGLVDVGYLGVLIGVERREEGSRYLWDDT